MWPVASFPQSFPKTFFGKPQSSLLTGSRSCQVSNGIKGSNATDYAGLRLDCTGGAGYSLPVFCTKCRRTRNIHTHTQIGRRCFIGYGVIILPGVKIGDEVIIGAGSVVTRNIPANCIAAGNPAKVIRTGINTAKYGRLKEDI